MQLKWAQPGEHDSNRVAGYRGGVLELLSSKIDSESAARER